MPDEPRAVVRRGYDRVAEAYLAARPDDSADVALLRDLLARLGSPGLVLDAGCGAGVPVTRLLAQAGHTVAALDCSTRQLSMARDRVPAAAVVQGDLGALPFHTGQLHAVVSFYAIIHVPRRDHPGILRECHRVLRPGGMALLCLGARDLAADHDPASWLGAPMYWSHYDAATNVELLRAAHLDLIDTRIVDDPMGHGHHLFALAARPDPPQ